MVKWIQRSVFILSVAATVLVAEDTTFTSYHFSGSGNCAMCHNGLSDVNGKDVSIETAWSSTMMANAAKDPLWRAKVRTEINRNPHLEEVINDKCTKCHAPMANKEAHYSGHVVKVFDDGFLDPDNTHHDEALNGVSCTLCHQVQDSDKLGSLEGFSGGYEIDESRTIYGPYDNVVAGPMRNNVNYNIQYSAHMKDSKMCASCHNLKTPFVDENGVVLSTTKESEFPEQMPYSEWEHSDFKDTKSCQECHMQRTNGVVIASRPPWLNTSRDDFAQHIFVGGNKMLLDIINNNKTALEVTSNNFEATIAKTDEMLKSAASLEVTNSALVNGVMDVSVKITSATGHKLPTSFPSRRAFVHFVVKNSSGAVVFESGKVNSDGSIVQADADADATTYEPHYDLITSADQVQIYEAVMGNNLDEVTYTLLRGMKYKKDNRILPKGFDKTTAQSDIKVVGNALDDQNFVGGSDTLSYRVSGLETGTYTVEIELLYQTLAYAFAQDLFNDTSSEVSAFKTMFNDSDLKTSQLGTTSATVSGTGSDAAVEEPIVEPEPVVDPEPATACNDGIDNDGDGLVDMSDPGCSDLSDNDEYNKGKKGKR